MFKPLLRTLPTLSGNMKLVGFLSNYEEIEDHVFSAYVRSARINALSPQLHNKYFNIALLGSSYEWDVCSFYKKYSEYFYKTLYEFNKTDLPIYKEDGINKNRNTDFEFGCKRVSHLKSGVQFGFYAPIYIESECDLPDYFEISIDIQNNTIKANRKIRVNIANNLEGAPNYLGKYLYDYALKIDDNVCYFNQNKLEGVYYGLDVQNGGFSIKHDTKFQSLMTKQNSILNFDSIISRGFERNKLIMKQIIPLSFYFSPNDIFSEIEKTMFYGAELRISGKWIKDNREVSFHDFELNYTAFSPQIKKMNIETGGMTLKAPMAVDKDGNISQINIMNIGYPSMKESLFYKYRFSNKMSHEFCRWKLKYSNDNDPYITNISPAFSFAQGSKTKYGHFPNLYNTCVGVVTKKPYYLNLFLPLNGGEYKYTLEHARQYELTMNKYCSNWFETFDNIDNALSSCVDVKDNKVYFNGILYDLSILQKLRKTTDDEIKIDKFGVFVKPVFHFISDAQIREKNIYSNFTIYKQNSDYIGNHKPNCHINDNVLTSTDPRLFANTKTLVKQDYLAHNEIFLTNEEDNGDFISLMKYGIDWYEANNFIRVEDLEDKIQFSLYSKIKDAATEGYELLPIGKLSNVIDSNNVLSKEYSKYYDLIISNSAGGMKTSIPENVMVDNLDLQNKNIVHDKSFYRKGTFIDRKAAENLIHDAYSYIVPRMYPGANQYEADEMIDFFSENVIKSKLDRLCSYTFNPVLNTSASITYASNVFVSSYNVSPRFYGDNIQYEYSKENKIKFDYSSSGVSQSLNALLNRTTYTYALDNDFIYVDMYNINNIIAHYNNTWLKDDKLKLAYYFRFPYFYGDDLSNPVLDNSIPYEMQVPHESNFNIYEYPELIKSLKEKYFFPYWKYDVNSSTYSLETKVIIGKNKYGLGLTIEPEIPLVYNTQEEAENAIKTSNYVDKSIAQTIRFNLFIDDSNSNDVYSLLEYLFASSGINEVVFKDKYPLRLVAIDELNSKDFYVKFLNKMHLLYYLKELYEENPSVSKFSPEKGYNKLSNIYIRKRVLDGYLNVQDAYIRLTDIIDSRKKTTGAHAIDDVLRLIDFDENTGLFYFTELDYRNGKMYKLNSDVDKPIISELLWWNFDDILTYSKNENNEDVIEVNPKKFKFELVFKKTMVRVDDNIWRLINLEEKYAAPYKDLYLYELEHYTEYNSNLYIQPLDSKLGYGGESEVDLPNIKYTLNAPGCLKPMFNLVEIETKDESRIYTEYSVCNITRSTILDGVLERHYYRHNCNNALCMLDLSTFNRNIPIDIKGKKYVYKKDWKFIEDLEDDDPRKSYVFFHDTYDLFKMNGVEFENYYDCKTSYEPIGVELKYVDQIFEVKGTYNTSSFAQLYPDIYNNSIYLTEAGETQIYSHEDYDHPESNSYISKVVIPTRPTEYRMTTYQKVTIEQEVEVWSNVYTYMYYNDLKLYDDFYLSTKTFEDEEGNETTYAFYLLDSHINNTTNSFNVISYEGEMLKFVSYINGSKLIDDEESIKAIYKQILPMVKNNPLKHLVTNAYTIVSPSLFNIDIDYHPIEVNDINGKLAYYDVLFKKKGWGNFVAERYLDNITPLILPKSSVNTYNLKYKNVEKSFKLTYFTNEVIYPLQTALNYYPGVRVYDTRKNNSYEVKADIEYKHFNANKMINLEEQFSYVYDDYLSEKEVRIAQSSSRVIKVFKNHLLDYNMSILDDKLMDWAFTKYKTTFGCEPVKLDATMEEKLYKLEIIFTLY